MIKKIERAKGIKIHDDDRIDRIIDEYIRETENKIENDNSFTDKEKARWSEIKADEVNMTLFSMEVFEGNVEIDRDVKDDSEEIDKVKPCDPI